jgi:hypothetical protein
MAIATRNAPIVYGQLLGVNSEQPSFSEINEAKRNAHMVTLIAVFSAKETTYICRY